MQLDQLRTNSSCSLLEVCALNITPVSYCLLHDHYYVCPCSEVLIVPLLSWLVFIYVTDEWQRRRHPIGQLVFGKRRWLCHHHRIHKISLLQLVLYIVAERVFRRVLESREKSLSASSCPSVRAAVCPHISITYHILYHISIQLPLYLDNTLRKHCCLSVATRHKVTIQATTVCWWANIHGIVNAELTSATDWRLSSTISLQLRSACKVSVVVFYTFPNSTICLGQFFFNLRIQGCSSMF
jgi:hypothetical protein